MWKQEEEVPNEIEAGEKMIERKSSFLLFITRKFKDDGQKNSGGLSPDQLGRN